MVDITANLKSVQQRIAAACDRAGRATAEVQLLAVGKKFSADVIREAADCGLTLFGENRVQEAVAKWPALKADFPDAEVHLIGPLQSNKVKQAVALFAVIQTLDRPKLARALAAEFDRSGRRLKCFIQINIGEEAQKAGVGPAQADGFIAACRDDLGLPIVGLMCIPPLDAEPAPYFALLAKTAARNDLDGVSMGMSADFETAIAFGATCVRVGSAIFGARAP